MSQKKNTPATAELDQLRLRAAELRAQTQSLQEKQCMYEQLLDSTRDMILVKDRRSSIVYANKAMCDLYGMTQEEIRGITDSTFNQPEFTAQYLKDDAYVIETGETLVIPEEPVTRHDGVIRLFETIKTPIREASGKVNTMVGVCRDITERAQAEQERERAERALDDTERLFRQMAESMRDVFWVALPDLSAILYVSPAYEKTWGRPCKELLQDPMSFLNAIFQGDRLEFMRKMEISLQSQDGSFTHEFRIVRSDGIRWLWIRTFPIRDEAGELVRVCGITHDITDRKEVERRVNEFNSLVSHELRTPLTSIRAALGLIEGGQTEPIGESTGDLIDIALVECDRMIRLIDDLLDIKKIETDSLDLRLQSLNAVEIVAEVLSANRSLAGEAKVVLRADIRANSVFLGDRDRIIQVLTNLLSNAIKFSPDNGEVVLSVCRTELRSLKFAVSDEGPGIDESQQSKLFAPFQQIDSSDSRTKGGTGLGLAISKAIIDKHGGKMGFETEPGSGSTFWFELTDGGGM